MSGPSKYVLYKTLQSTITACSYCLETINGTSKIDENPDLTL